MAGPEVGVLAALVSAILALAWKAFIAPAKMPPKILHRLAQLEVKVDTLWSIDVQEALLAARRSGLTERRSPERPTKKWEQIVAPQLRQAIAASLCRKSEYLNGYDLAIDVWAEFRDALGKLADAENLSVRAFFGVIQVLAERQKEGPIDGSSPD